MMLLRMEACAGSRHDLAHMPTQKIARQIASQKASAKADIVITALKTGKLLDV